MHKYFLSDLLGSVYQQEQWFFQGYAFNSAVVGRMINESYEKLNKYINNLKISEAKSVVAWKVAKMKTQNNLNHIDEYIEVCIKVCEVLLSQERHEKAASICQHLLKSLPEYHIERLRVHMILLSAFVKLEIENEIQKTFVRAVEYIDRVFGQKSLALVPIYRIYASYLSKNENSISIA